MWLAILKFIKVYSDIKVYRDYVNIIKKEYENSPIWVRKGMRIDWFGRIYTVVNLPPEVLFSADLPKEARPSFVMNEIKPINEYFKAIDVQQIKNRIITYKKIHLRQTGMFVFIILINLCLT